MEPNLLSPLVTKAVIANRLLPRMPSAHSPRLQCASLTLFLLCSITAWAANANKEFKGNGGTGNGNASGNGGNPFVDTTGNVTSAPGTNDVVKIAHGKKVDIDLPVI